MRKYLLFSVITSSIFTLIACKDSTIPSLKEAKTTREAIQAINGVEYKSTNGDSGYIKFTDIGTKSETLLGSKLANAGVMSNIWVIDNQDPNKPYEYEERYFNEVSQNKITFWNFNIHLYSDTLELLYTKRTPHLRYIFKRNGL
ncbi:hypothetical protein [Cellulophaga sp. BC115SP]|uniref:hypothetical protein n=1 Tax=Cellulophaga sp. BC115SP TaxID=2683263 RepID=UPI001412B424|nr:hypothetical protein [Cellulophaga sp. BC115SP]NBB26999.1 hypothetical protein [Cellulophaga sp. BC115SP]